MAAMLENYPAERLASCPSYGREAPKGICEMNPHSANFRLHLEVSSKSGGLATKFEVGASHDGFYTSGQDLGRTIRTNIRPECF